VGDLLDAELALQALQLRHPCCIRGRHPPALPPPQVRFPERRHPLQHKAASRTQRHSGTAVSDASVLQHLKAAPHVQGPPIPKARCLDNSTHYDTLQHSHVLTASACKTHTLCGALTVLEAAYSAWYRRRARRRGASCPRHACRRRTAWHSSRTAPMAWRHQAAGSAATAVCNTKQTMYCQQTAPLASRRACWAYCRTATPKV
jgi:hypothetical protein